MEKDKLNIILLKGIYPLKKKIPISEFYGIEFDNPQSDFEIDIVRRYLESNFIHNPTITPSFLRQAINNIPNNKIENELFDVNKLRIQGDEYTILAKNWLIARFDYKMVVSRYNKDISNPEWIKPMNVYHYLYILNCVMTETEEINELDKYILTKSDDISLNIPYIFQHHYDSIKVFNILYSTVNEAELTLYDSPFNLIIEQIEQIKSYTAKMDILLSKNSIKIDYLGEVLRTITESIDDPQIQFIMLISIIELLLTHSPDNSRFNVEDSINKQFQLKTGIVINKYKKTKLSEIKNRLKYFYSLRSNIVHGNFKQISKENVKDKLGIEIYKNVDEVYGYVSVILKAYIDDSEFIDTLKEM